MIFAKAATYGSGFSFVSLKVRMQAHLYSARKVHLSSRKPFTKNAKAASRAAKKR
jgi:hypothetical protein